MKTMIGSNLSAEQLRSVIQRIERLEEEKATLAADIRDVYAEAKAKGLETAAIRQIIKLRKKDVAERDEAQAILDTYLRALGMRPELEEEE